MALKRLFTNNAVSLLAEGISALATQLTVVTGHGERFPTPQAEEFFTITLEDQAATVQEIVHCTQRVGDVFTIVRAQESTTARAWSASPGNETLVDHRLTAGALTYLDNTQGSSSVSSQVIDAAITTTVNGGQTVITLPSEYQAGTTAVYVGGLRQKRGIDFIESAPLELRLQFVLTSSQIIDGQNVVVDYMPA